MEEILALVLGYTILGLFIILLLVSLSNGNKNQARYIIWHYWSWIQFIKWSALINTPSADESLKFFKHLIKVFKPDPLNKFSPHSSVPERFKDLGIGKAYFLNNAEIPLIVWSFFAVLYVVILTLKVKSLESIRRSVCDSLIIRNTLLFFMEFLIYSMLQIKQFEITSIYGIINSVLSVIVICCLLIFFIAISSIVIIKLKDNSTLERISTVTEEFNQQSIKYNLYYILFLLQRVIACISYIFLQDHPKIQCFIIELILGVTCNFYIVIYILFIRPFTKSLINIFLAILETTSIIICALIGSYSLDTVSNSNKENMHYLIVSLLFSSIPLFLFFIFKLNKSPLNPAIHIEKSANSNLVFNSSIETVQEVKIGKLNFFKNKSNEKVRNIDKVLKVDKMLHADNIKQTLNESGCNTPQLPHRVDDRSEEFKVSKGQDLSNQVSQRIIENSVSDDVENRIPYFTALYGKHIKKIMNQ